MLLTEEQKLLRDAARRYSRERLLPAYGQREKAGKLEPTLLRELGQMGLLCADLPQELGGMGLSGTTAGLIIEELSYGDFNVGSVAVVATLVAAILARNASPELARRWVPAMVRGEATVALAITEPRGGSDAANMQLRARRDGEAFVLNGEKTSVTFSATADAFVVFARTGRPEDGARGVTALLVPADTPGIRATRFEDVGNLALSRGSIFFDDVRAPAVNCVGAEGKGFTQVMQGFDYSRALIALQCCGAAQASLDEAWSYSKEREAFGRPIGQFQGVSFPLAEGESHIAAVRQLCYHTLSLRDAGAPHTAEAAMCKWMGPKTAFDVIHQCLLTFGHYGYSKETPHQQRLRDVMGLEIGDGTAGVMKLIVARERIGRAAVQY
ncbi:MAG: cyclohexanecarboxyl-CoA dehydrogenase [Ramlibacter sp.]|nr:cyclohexanecarboxyl-CoA dehydrogenase [Ramlibacter sp.]